MRYMISIIALVVLSGCSKVQGFRAMSDGHAGPDEMLAAAAAARAEANALEAIAGQHFEQRQRAVGAARETAELLGAPEIVTGLVGALGGLFVPSPLGRRKSSANSAESRSE